MIRKFFIAIVVLAVIFSCNDESKKNNSIKEDKVKVEVKTGDNTRMLYLDTAESIQNILCQDWVMQDDAEALEGMDENSKVEIPYRSFFVSTNGTFVKNPRNAMDYGHWIYNDAVKTITFNNTEEGKDVYKIAKLTYDELVLVNAGMNTITNLKFVGSGKRFKNAYDEPFLIDNNQWRIKPRSRETDAEIHKRLKDNLHFFVLFYKSVLAKDEQTVSFWGLPSCFKWYGGGIYIKKKDELKENWKECFYNEEQAMQAYALADKLISQHYTWPKGERNWIKQNLAVLEQMYKKIDEIH